MRYTSKWFFRICGLVVLLGFGPLGCIQPAAQPAPPISVAGEYSTAVTLTDDNSCGSVEVQSLPTTIDQEPGATPMTFTHAGHSYAGTIETNGHFDTAPTPLTIGQATYTITVQGQFSLSGFDALTTVAVKQPQAPQNCRYVVRMVGSKTNGTNTIP